MCQTIPMAELLAKNRTDPGFVAGYTEVDYSVIAAMLRARIAAGLTWGLRRRPHRHHPSRHREAGGRGGIADGGDAAEICEGCGEKVKGGDGVGCVMSRTFWGADGACSHAPYG